MEGRTGISWIRSHRGTEQRSITLKDLSRGNRHPQDEDRGQGGLDLYLSLPNLKSINLKGP
jgi:hypothetical protein